jgi:hypothetical protein
MNLLITAALPGRTAAAAASQVAVEAVADQEAEEEVTPCYVILCYVIVLDQ